MFQKGFSRMSWIYLSAAGIFEIVWAVCMKYSMGFTRLCPSVFTVLAMAASVFLLALSMRTLPLGTSYAVWTGIGTVGTAVIGMIAFGEPATAARLLCLGMIAAGIVGLRLIPFR